METKKAHLPVWAVLALIVACYVANSQPVEPSPLHHMDRVMDVRDVPATVAGINWFDTKFIFSLPKPKGAIALQENMEAYLAAYLSK